jgi:phosphoserine aminotransferase
MTQVLQTEQKQSSQTERVFNFSPGPAVLPLSVLEQIQSELISYPGAGMSVMEMSHRSANFENIIQTTEKDLRQLLGIPSNYKVIFLQGGASLQFAMLPMNLLPKEQSADYILSGSWAQLAYKEAKKLGKARVAASTESENFSRLPTQAELDLDAQAAYVHFTSNNTIYGTQWRTEPAVGNVPLACDASSDILSRPLDVSKYGVIYAGTQKNAGTAGVTLVIVREDLLERVPANLPSMLDYKLMAEKDSLYNTPPTFSIYVTGLVVRWLLSMGGLAEMERRNVEKAHLLYQAIDDSNGFYKGHAKADSRSLMNVVFRLPNEELEKQFIKESTALGLDGLKGHRSVGGLRASLYNAFPLEGVKALVEFMRNFQKKS